MSRLLDPEFWLIYGIGFLFGWLFATHDERMAARQTQEKGENNGL
jgi:hypothetical protein